MRILKFGGTSIGASTRIKHVADLITQDNSNKIIVLSAMAGTTNTLANISEYLHNKNIEAATELIYSLKSKYIQTINNLYLSQQALEESKSLIKSHFDYILGFTQGSFTVYEEKAVLAQGELISTALMHLYLKEKNIDSVLLSALNFMRTNENNEPDFNFIKTNLSNELKQHENSKLFITQGYICRNAFGEIDNLHRGGSDYTASIIGASVNANIIEIWTDIDGLHNNDPRFVENTHPLSKLSFDEAAELAYFGAKILHPASITPAKIANIPVLLKNTLQPKAKGTIISNETTEKDIKAVAAKDGIIVIKIKSGRMLLAYGFLRKVFEVFEIYKTSIDMITTSEVAVSLTIDDNKFLHEIEKELKKYGTVEIEQEMSIVCIVGNFIADNKGQAYKIFKALQPIPLRMISYGGSKHNVSILIKSSDKVKALNLLNKHLF